jgi:hypothetical protein
MSAVMAVVNWSAADPNGSPILNYVMTINPGGTQDAVGGTATSLRVSVEPRCHQAPTPSR